MKKILLILNESHTPPQLIKTAIKIAKESNSLLEAIFLKDTGSLNFSYPFPNDMYLTGEAGSAKTRSEQSMKLVLDMVAELRDECEAEKIQFNFEIDKTVSIKHLITLTRFADLVVADSNYGSGEYDLNDILSDAHCPILLVSRYAVPAEKIFLAYDGSASSMFAIKMFAYLFPEFKDLPTQLFHIAPAEIFHIAHIDEIRSWASLHFSNFDVQVIPGGDQSLLVDHISARSEQAIIVMGAYGGSALARIFFKSTAAAVINKTSATLFITHH